MVYAFLRNIPPALWYMGVKSTKKALGGEPGREEDNGVVGKLLTADVALAGQPPLIYISFNGEIIELTDYIIKDGVYYIGLAELGKKMGREVTWIGTPGGGGEIWIAGAGWRNVSKEYDPKRSGVPFIENSKPYYRLDNALKMVGLSMANIYENNISSFLDALGNKESGNDYTIVNRYGYMGKYQFGDIALRDIGFYDKNNNWTAKAKEYGVTSKETFLNNPDAQEAAVRMLLENNWRYFTNYGLLKYVGTTMNGIELTESGLLAAAHLVGIGDLKAALEANDLTSKRNRNGVTAKDYIEMFGGYNVDEITKKK